MSHDLYTYGSTGKIYFKLTLSGVAVTGVTLDAADVKLSKDGAAFTNIGSACAETTAGLGWYAWTPGASTDTQCEVMIINVKDNAGSAFDENGLVITTGGSASARFGG